MNADARLARAEARPHHVRQIMGQTCDGTSPKNHLFLRQNELKRRCHDSFFRPSANPARPSAKIAHRTPVQLDGSQGRFGALSLRHGHSPPFRDKSMQRVRVGLTGLACVFLLVMLATAFLRMADTSGTGGNAAVATSNTTAPNEPLAQLGVAPGNPMPAEPVPNGAVPTKPATAPAPTPAAPAEPATSAAR
jgi:hypothetical protein